MRRSLMAVSLTLVALISWPGIVVAGGWSTVKLDSLPTDVVAGEGTNVGFTVLQHGERPLPNLEAYITATNVETGERLRFDAINQGEPGHYQAQVTLPSEGTWEWSVNGFEGDHWLPPLRVIAAGQMQSEPVAGTVVAEAEPNATSLTLGRQIAVGVGAVGIVMLVSAGLLAFAARRSASHGSQPAMPAPSLNS